MKERIAELKLKLQECSATISELAEAGVTITLSVDTPKKAVTFTCGNPTEIVITSATVATEL